MIRCTVCRSPRLAEVNGSVASGHRSASVAAKFGVSEQALRRHVRNGHVPPVAPTAPTSAPTVAGPDGTPADLIRAIVRSLDDIDPTKLGSAAQIALFAERRRAAESLAKVAASSPVDDSTARRLAVLEEIGRVQDEVLERHPAVREEVAAALIEWKAARVAREGT